MDLPTVQSERRPLLEQALSYLDSRRDPVHVVDHARVFDEKRIRIIYSERIVLPMQISHSDGIDYVVMPKRMPRRAHAYSLVHELAHGLLHGHGAIATRPLDSIEEDREAEADYVATSFTRLDFCTLLDEIHLFTARSLFLHPIATIKIAHGFYSDAYNLVERCRAGKDI